MKSPLKAVIIVAVCLMTTNAVAASGYKDFTFGLTIDQMKSKCETVIDFGGTEKMCLLKGKDPINFSLNADEKVNTYYLTFPFTNETYIQIRNALNEKYTLTEMFIKEEIVMFEQRQIDTVSAWFDNRTVEMRIYRKEDNSNGIRVVYHALPVPEKKVMGANDF